MPTGRVLRFDEARGYGFIAPDMGGEDVFLHANDLGSEKYLIRPGVAVEFDLEAGERGLKASAVRVLGATGAGAVEVRRRVATPSQQASSREPGQADEDDEVLCDVLSAAELRQELTEVLLKEVPALTGGQILAVRESVLRLAGAHGWTES
nr:cold shock domain-containing protein [Micromonospora sp. DSM 115978]